MLHFLRFSGGTSPPCLQIIFIEVRSLEAEDCRVLILVSFVLHRGDSSLCHWSRRSADLAAAGQRKQGCSGLGFLSAMKSLLALWFFEREQMQCLKLLYERKSVGGNYWPVMASTVCKGPKQSSGQ